MKHQNLFRFFRYCATVICILAASVTATCMEQEVSVVNSEDGVKLAGTLLIPDSGAPKGIVIMATGSGQQNRDEELLGHKPFKTIAEFLASRGYASLRLDDRGIGGSTGDFSTATTLDFVKDIQAALAFASDKLQGIPAGVLGHSQGGLVGIMTAANDPGCRFLITIGAPAWRGDSIIMSQARAISNKMTGKWDGEAKQRRYLDIAMSNTSTPQAKLTLQIAITADLGDMAKMPGVEAQINQQIEVMVSPDYRWMLRYDPASDIERVSVPWLALNGDMDIQVLPGNLETIKQLNPNADTMLLSNHNHLLQNCKTGLPMEYAQINEDISTEALQKIADWLDSNIKPL